jgi:hypothetical protein
MLDSYASPIDPSLHPEIHRVKSVLPLQRERTDEESDVDYILAVRVLEDTSRADLHPLGIDIMMEVLRTSLDLTRGYGSYLLANALLEDTEYNDPRNAAVALSLYCLAEELGVTKAKKAAQKLKKQHGIRLHNTLIRFMLFSLITAWKKRSFDRASKEGTSVALLGLEQEEDRGFNRRNTG